MLINGCLWWRQINRYSQYIGGLSARIQDPDKGFVKWAYDRGEVRLNCNLSIGPPDLVHVIHDSVITITERCQTELGLPT